MIFLRCFLLVVMSMAALSSAAAAQDLGALEISGRVKIDGKNEKVTRKRFYLFRGGLEANKALIGRIRSAAVAGRDCFYCEAKASPEYIAWLKAENCESPYCRAITKEDIAKVPEFQVAYQKGLKQFRGKDEIASKWITTNLPETLRDGFYKREKASIESIIGDSKALQSSMTDTVSVRSIFIDIPLELSGRSTQTFLISNVIPVEIGAKSYVWACELEIGAAKRVIYQLQVPQGDKPVKKCEIVVRDVPVCGAAGSCVRK